MFQNTGQQTALQKIHLISVEKKIPIIIIITIITIIIINSPRLRNKTHSSAQ